MLDVCCEVTSCDEYVAMVKTEKRMSAQPTCCYTVTFATRSLLRRSVVPAKVSTRDEYSLPAESETPNALVWERSTPWITERDTAQTETERVLARLVTAHPWIAVCIKSKRVFAYVIHVLNVLHPLLSSRVARTTRPSFSTRTSRTFQKNYVRTGVRKLLRTGLVSARAWRGQAMGIAPTER